MEGLKKVPRLPLHPKIRGASKLSLCRRFFVKNQPLTLNFSGLLICQALSNNYGHWTRSLLPILEAVSSDCCSENQTQHLDYRGVNPVSFPRMARWNHFAPSGLDGRLPAGGTNGQSSFSEFPSLLLRVARRGSAAAHSSSAPGHRNRGFYRPISCCDPLNAGCNRTSRAVGRPAIFELKPLYCCSSSSRRISNPSHSSSAPVSASRNSA
jgi:hypothetical protein